MNRPSKVLLVTEDKILRAAVIDTLQSQSVEVVCVNNVDMAIEKILANGFSLTILDCEMSFPTAVTPEDLIKLNHISCKAMLLIGSKAHDKRAAKALKKSLSTLPVWRIDVNDIKHDVLEYFNKHKEIEFPSQREMFNDIMNDIKQAKKSLFYKVVNFLF